ncbi:glutathione S-transferase [Rhizobium tibeticum]|nr:glutathione S-transferase [Rhizobium tibeticum]
MEPPIVDREIARYLEGDKTWYEERRSLVEERIRKRLSELSDRLGDADWLDGEFSAGDLQMVSVLLRVKGSGILAEYPNLSAYVARGQARPACKPCLRCSVGGFHRRNDRLTKVRGLEPSSKSFAQFMGLTLGAASLIDEPRRSAS